MRSPSPSGLPRRRAELIRLFEFEPDLLASLVRDEAEPLVERTVVESVSLGAGVVEPPAVPAAEVDLGYLVLEGLLLHRVGFVGRRTVEVIGPGDLIRPWRPPDGAVSVPPRVDWKICEPARLAVLDRRFEAGLAHVPAVRARILDRLDARHEGLALQLALAQIPRLEARLLWLFWHLADRWGRMERDGAVVHLKVSQTTLGDLVSARRPSVSHALGSLREQGALMQIAPGRWLLRAPPPDDWSERAHSALSGA